MSSSEMSCLVKNFRFLVGDLVPFNEEIWNFYLNLFDIIHILLKQGISFNHLVSLETLIQNHHKEYLKLFKRTLKPKHHLLLHYPRIIRKIWPPVLLSAERNEAKHKDFKSNAHNMRSRKNVPLSLSLRMQEKCCHRFLAQRTK